VRWSADSSVGVLENVLGAFVIGNELKLAVALVLIIGVLTVKAVRLLRQGPRHARMTRRELIVLAVLLVAAARCRSSSATTARSSSRSCSSTRSRCSA
jgi:hypothetical protein